MNITSSSIRKFEESISKFQKELAEEDDKEEKSEWKIRISDEKGTLKFLWDGRIDNWKNTFRIEGGETGYGLIIYEKFGHNFRMPTKTQFKDLLSALDKQHPGWDEVGSIENIGSSFFRTLETNFPELKKSPQKRSGTTQIKKGSSGCLFVIVLAIMALTLWSTL